MDVEKLKKVNKLATTLRDKGLAEGRQEAAMLAGQMNYEDDQGMERVFSEEPKQEPLPEQASNEEQQKPQMSERKIMNILQDFADQFSKEVNALNDKIQEQEKAMEEMAQEIKRLKSSEQPQQKLNSGSQQVQQEQPKQETQEKPKQENNEQPRSGSYESDDVSIQKFFYCGTN